MPAVVVDDTETFDFEISPEDYWSFTLVRGWVMFLPGLPDRAFRLYCKLRSMIVHGNPRTLRRMTVDQICWLMTNPGDKPVSESTAKNMLRSLRTAGLIEDIDGDKREPNAARRYRVKELPGVTHLGVRNSWDYLDAYTRDWRTGGQNSAPLTNPDNPNGVKSDISTQNNWGRGQNFDLGGQNSDRGGQNSGENQGLTCGNASPYKAPSYEALPSCSSSSSSSSSFDDDLDPRRADSNEAPAAQEEENDSDMTTTDSAQGGEVVEVRNTGFMSNTAPKLPAHLAETGEAYFSGTVPLPTQQARSGRPAKAAMNIGVPETAEVPQQTQRRTPGVPQKAPEASVTSSANSKTVAQQLAEVWVKERALYGYGTTRTIQKRIVKQAEAHLDGGEQQEILASALRAMAAQRTWLCLDKHLEHYAPQGTGNPDGLTPEQTRATVQLRGLAGPDGAVSWQRLEEWRERNNTLLAACGWVGDGWDAGLRSAGIVWVKGRGNVLVSTT